MDDDEISEDRMEGDGMEDEDQHGTCDDDEVNEEVHMLSLSGDTHHQLATKAPAIQCKSTPRGSCGPRSISTS